MVRSLTHLVSILNRDPLRLEIYERRRRRCVELMCLRWVEKPIASQRLVSNFLREVRRELQREGKTPPSTLATLSLLALGN